MGTELEITVDGRWIAMESPLGSVEMSTVWPGGSDELTWIPGADTARRFAGDEKVVVYFGGVPVWAGSLLEPDASAEEVTAVGAWHEGYKFAAIDGAGATSKSPNTAIDAAVVRGLRWTRPTSIQGGDVGLDLTTGPISVGSLLDQMAAGQTVRWGVNPLRQIYKQDDSTLLALYQTLSLAGGLGYALDGYASSLIGRYLDSTTSTYKTRTVATTGGHGTVERILDLTDRGAMTAAGADGILGNMASKLYAVPAWTRPVEVVYGELLNMGGVPAALETVAAGQLIRVNGSYELAARENGLMAVDFVIGRTQLSEGVLTISPLQLASRSLVDALS